MLRWCTSHRDYCVTHSLTPLQLTIWFPIHLHGVIKIVCPKVDMYSELGTRRSNSDMDREYQRLLNRDSNPLNFLYHGRCPSDHVFRRIKPFLLRLPARMGDLRIPLPVCQTHSATGSRYHRPRQLCLPFSIPRRSHNCSAKCSSRCYVLFLCATVPREPVPGPSQQFKRVGVEAQLRLDIGYCTLCGARNTRERGS